MPPGPPRVAFVLHVMQVAGAEVLVSEIIKRLGTEIVPTVFCLDAVGALGERVRAEGVDVIAFGRRPGRDWGLAWRMALALRERSIDVVHAHQYTPFFYSALARALAGRRPRLILTEHGRHFPDVVSPRRRAVNRLVLDRLADSVNAVCAFSARALQRNDGFSGARVEVIPNGIELSRYSRPADRRTARERVGLDGARRHVACVARFHRVKDHPTLLRAFVGVAASQPDVDLLLVGDGPDRPALEALAGSLGIGARVRFLGVRSDVPQILGAIDVFALTSVSEAASITLLEAMACATPIVVTAVGGNPEIVRHEREALLAPRGGHAALGRAIERLLGDPEGAERMGRAARARVEERYRLELTVERYRTLYRRLASHA